MSTSTAQQLIADNHIAFIIPTKDRPADLRQMFDSLQKQTRKPDQIIIVDASLKSIRFVCEGFPSLSVNYLRWTEKPSAARQRNGGLALLNPEINWVCFFDDDQVLHPDALKKAEDFIQKNSDVAFGGLAFCSTDYEKENRSFALKDSWISRKLGLYAPPGQVAPSGWQSVIRNPKTNIALSWMSSAAMLLKRDVLKEIQFDHFFQGYSYLEDLDFSYSVSRKYSLYLLTDAKFDHFHSSGGRSSQYEFGIMEIRNRRYFVRKHRLSVFSYRLAAFLRWCMSLVHGEFSRALGNIRALFS